MKDPHSGRDQYAGIGGDELRDYGYEGPLAFRDEFFLQLGRSITTNTTILDAGCGSADLSINIATSNPNPTFICTDYEYANIQIARRAAAAAGVAHRFHFINSSATAIPLPKASVGFAFACSVFSYCKNPLQTIRRFYQLVEPGGLAAFDVSLAKYQPPEQYASIDWAHEFHYFTAREISQIKRLPGLEEYVDQPPVALFKFRAPD
jgi:ubiquinone/menaquinone biosynthesis C-methylase UbiE